MIYQPPGRKSNRVFYQFLALKHTKIDSPFSNGIDSWCIENEANNTANGIGGRPTKHQPQHRKWWWRELYCRWIPSYVLKYNTGMTANDHHSNSVLFPYSTIESVLNLTVSHLAEEEDEEKCGKVDWPANSSIWRKIDAKSICWTVTKSEGKRVPSSFSYSNHLWPRSPVTDCFPFDRDIVKCYK